MQTDDRFPVPTPKIKSKSNLVKKIKKAKTSTDLQKISPLSTSSESSGIQEFDVKEFSQTLAKKISESSSASVNCMDSFLESLKKMEVPFNILMAVLEALRPFFISK